MLAATSETLQVLRGACLCPACVQPFLERCLAGLCSTSSVHPHLKTASELCFGTQTAQHQVLKLLSLRSSEGSECHVHSLAREGSVSLGGFQRTNQIYFCSCGRQTAVCQEALQRPKRYLSLVPCRAVGRAGAN